LLGIEYCKSAEKKAIVSVVISILLGAIALIVPLAVNLLQFITTIQRLKRERHSVFFDLAKSPKSEFVNLKKRIDDLDKDKDEDGDLEMTTMETKDNDKSKETTGEGDDGKNPKKNDDKKD
jgi:hypothetical protein